MSSSNKRNRSTPLLHALDHLNDHNIRIVQFMVRDLTLDTAGMAMVGDVFARTAKQFQRHTPAGRPRRKEDGKLWFMRWNLIDTARELYKASRGHDLSITTDKAKLASLHDKNITKLREKLREEGKHVWPEPTSVDDAEDMVRLRYPGLLDVGAMSTVLSDTLCHIGNLEDAPPVGPLSKALIDKIHMQFVQEMMAKPSSSTPLGKHFH